MTPLISILSILLILLVLLRFYHNRSIEGFEGKSKSIVICKADWCGHCKKAAPEFQKLLAASPITLNDGTKATVKILDHDQHKSEIAKHNIKGYPTVLIVDGGQSTEYPGERKAEHILNFLNSNY
jgi:thiol-disulfide isomerase/thioredoxin